MEGIRLLKNTRTIWMNFENKKKKKIKREYAILIFLNKRKYRFDLLNS